MTLAEAAKYMRQNKGRRVHIKTLLRWIKKGLKGGVHLNAEKIGGVWHTSRLDIQFRVMRGRRIVVGDGSIRSGVQHEFRRGAGRDRRLRDLLAGAN